MDWIPPLRVPGEIDGGETALTRVLSTYACAAGRSPTRSAFHFTKGPVWRA